MNKENINTVSDIIGKSIDYHVSSILSKEKDSDSVSDFVTRNSNDIHALNELTTLLNNFKGIEFLNANIDAQGAISQAVSGIDLSNMDFSNISKIMSKMGG